MNNTETTLDWKYWVTGEDRCDSPDYWAAGSCGCCVYTMTRRARIYDDGRVGTMTWGLYQSDRGRLANAIPGGLTFGEARAVAQEWDREYHGERYWAGMSDEQVRAARAALDGEWRP